MLEKRTMLADSGNQICVHGFKVSVKDRTLKRSSSLLKHSRFLNNLVVTPVYPQPIVEEDANEGQEGEDQDD